MRCRQLFDPGVFDLRDICRLPKADEYNAEQDQVSSAVRRCVIVDAKIRPLSDVAVETTRGARHTVFWVGHGPPKNFFGWAKCIWPTQKMPVQNKIFLLFSVSA
jgi:hypothetical protein